MAIISISTIKESQTYKALHKAFQEAEDELHLKEQELQKLDKKIEEKEEQHNKSLKELKEKKNAYETLATEYEEMKANWQKAEAESHARSNEVAKLGMDNRHLREELETIYTDRERLKNELEEQKHLTEVVAKDEIQKFIETKRKLADELYYGHSLLSESLAMEMSVELGFILRDHLKEIYDILSKYEITVGAQ